MLRLLLELWVVFVVALCATLPVTGVTAWAEQGCEGCPCDSERLGEEGHPGEAPGGDSCPPQCDSCHCTLLAAVDICEPGWSRAPCAQGQVSYAEPPEILIPGEPQPIYTPPERA